jgi:hypothetical protein
LLDIPLGDIATGAASIAWAQAWDTHNNQGSVGTADMCITDKSSNQKSHSPHGIETSAVVYPIAQV